MYKIYIVRHAKSSWADLGSTDFDRTLNKRGERDAPIMAKFLKSNNVVVDIMISSAAKRALQTSEYFKKNLQPKRYEITRFLYHAPPSHYWEKMMELDHSIETVMFFGHNPGITHLANEVSQKSIDNVPTCGILELDSRAASWQDVDATNTHLSEFYYPKMFL